MRRSVGVCIAFLLCCCLATMSFQYDETSDTRKEKWIQLFNGKDLDDWTPKFAGHEVGVNAKNTFRVTKGKLVVSYDEYDVFEGQFGHLFYKDKYSHYKLRAQYRFIGEQVDGGPGWAYANNGLMLHCQDPATMTVDQKFPLSLECQLLGAETEDVERPTANLCTPGSHVTLHGDLTEEHCLSTHTGPSYKFDTWVTIEAVVLGDSILHHVVDGDTVLTYTNPVVGGGLDGLDAALFTPGGLMSEGYISIQAETHSTEFKKIELLDLCGCMDPMAKNYKEYFLISDVSKCLY